MRNAIRRVLSLILAVLLCVGFFPASALAESEGGDYSVQAEPSITGESSVGMLLANTVAAEQNTQEEAANRITAVEYDGMTAKVEYLTDRTAYVVVAFYREDGLEMLACESARVNAGTESMELIVPGFNPSPDTYYIIGAYLLDAEDNAPLCKEFLNTLHTKAAVDLLSSTIDDYDPERVLNLDSDPTNNFVVFSETTVIARASGSSNQTSDNGNGSYTVRNADEKLRTLRRGDAYAIFLEDNTVIIGVAAAVFCTGDTVTITEDPGAELADVCEAVKIDENSSGKEMTVDASNIPDGIALVESGDYTELNSQHVDTQTISRALDAGGSVNKYFKLELNFVDQSTETSGGTLSGTVTVKGSVGFGFGVDLRILISFDYYYVLFKFETSLDYDFEVSGKIKTSLPMGKITLPLLLGTFIEFEPSFIVEAEAKLTFEYTICTTVGFCVESDQEPVNLSHFPKGEPSVELEGSIFVGIEFEPKAVAIHEKIANASVSTRIGVEASVKPDFGNPGTDITEDTKVLHDCEKCFKGKLYLRAKEKAVAKLLDGEVCNFEYTLFDGKIYIDDQVNFDPDERGAFYLSSIDGFVWARVCPHKRYRVRLVLQDKENNPISGIEITGTEDLTNPVTDDTGKATFFLPNGNYTLGYTVNGTAFSKKTVVQDVDKEITIIVDGTLQSVDDPEIITSGTWGDNLSWRLTDQGTLIFSGSGEMADGITTTYRPWQDYRSVTNNLIIESGITSIGLCAFENYTFENVTLPESVVEIDNFAFAGCHFTRGLILPSKLECIGFHAFEGCQGLNDIILPDTINKIFWYAFSESDVTSIKIPESLSEVQDYTFEKCSNLVSVTFSKNLTRIGPEAFDKCTSLKSVTIPKNVTSISNAFTDCISLQTICFEHDSTDQLSLDHLIFGFYADIGEHIETIKTTVFVPNPSNVHEEIMKAFKYNGLREVTFATLTNTDIDEDVTSINTAACPGNSTDKDSAENPDYCFDDLPATDVVIIDSSKNILEEPSDTQATENPVSGESPSETEEETTDKPAVLEASENPDTGAPSDTQVPEGKTDPAVLEDPTETDESQQAEDPAETVESQPTEDPVETDETQQAEEATEEEKEEPPVNDQSVSEQSEPALIAESLAMFEGSNRWNGNHQVVDMSNLVPGAEYVFIIAKSLSVEHILNSDNLLFIAQSTADAAGRISFDYVTNWDMFSFPTMPQEVAFGPANPDTLEGRDGELLWLDQTYLLLRDTDTVTLIASAASDELLKGLQWGVTDENGNATENPVVYVDDIGKVTPMRPGTGYVVVSSTMNGTVYSSRCRVDVLDEMQQRDSQGDWIEAKASLPVTSAAVDLYRTVYVRIEVDLNLVQNLNPDGIETSDAVPVWEDPNVPADPQRTPVTIVRAALENAEKKPNNLNEVFTLRPVDDRTLEIVPIVDLSSDNAVNAVLSNYQARIKVELSNGTSTVTDEVLKIKVNKKLPKIKAEQVSLNSFILGDTKQIHFVGGTVTSAEIEQDFKKGIAWFYGEDHLSVRVDNSVRKGSETVKLRCSLSDWAVDTVVPVSVKTSYQAPKLSFKPATLTLNPNVGYDIAETVVTLKPLPGFTGHRIEPGEVYEGKQLQFDVLKPSYYPDTGLLSVKLGSNKPLDSKAHTYKFWINVDGNPLAAVTVKVLAQTPKTEPKLSAKASGAVDTAVTDSPAILTLSGSNFNVRSGEDYRVTEIWQQKGREPAVNVIELFRVRQDPNRPEVFRITAVDDAAAQTLKSQIKGYTYSVMITGRTGENQVLSTGSVKFTVKNSVKAPAVTASLKTSGSIDVLRPDTSIILTPAISNFYTHRLDVSDLVFYRNKSEITDAEQIPFDITLDRAKGIFEVKIADTASVNPKDKYTVALRLQDVPITGKTGVQRTYTSKTISLPVKMAPVKLTQSKKAVTLLKRDRYDSESIILKLTGNDLYSLDEADVVFSSPTVSVKQNGKTVKLPYLELHPLGSGEYAICYKDNLLPNGVEKLKSASATLTVYLKGNGSHISVGSLNGTANATVRLTVKFS